MEKFLSAHWYYNNFNVKLFFKKFYIRFYFNLNVFHHFSSFLNNFISFCLNFIKSLFNSYFYNLFCISILNTWLMKLKIYFLFIRLKIFYKIQILILKPWSYILYQNINMFKWVSFIKFVCFKFKIFVNTYIHYWMFTNILTFIFQLKNGLKLWTLPNCISVSLFFSIYCTNIKHNLRLIYETSINNNLKFIHLIRNFY